MKYLSYIAGIAALMAVLYGGVSMIHNDGYADGVNAQALLQNQAISDLKLAHEEKIADMQKTDFRIIKSANDRVRSIRLSYDSLKQAMADNDDKKKTKLVYYANCRLYDDDLIMLRETGYSDSKQRVGASTQRALAASLSSDEETEHWLATRVKKPPYRKPATIRYQLVRQDRPDNSGRVQTRDILST